jgi:hypothetical protein
MDCFRQKANRISEVAFNQVELGDRYSLYESTVKKAKNCNDQGQQFTLVLRRVFVSGVAGNRVANGEMYKRSSRTLADGHCESVVLTAVLPPKREVEFAHTGY